MFLSSILNKVALCRTLIQLIVDLNHLLICGKHQNFNSMRNTFKINKQRRLSMRRKWTAKEIAAVVDYLLENRNIEKPTAQIYYRKFLDHSKLNIPWSLVKWKVRNLRLSFSKAKKMKQSIEAGILKETEKERLKQLWPHFDKLQALFDVGDVCDVDDSINSSLYSDIYTITTLEDSNELSPLFKIECEKYLNCNPLSPQIAPKVTLQEPDQPNSADLNGLQETINHSQISPICSLQEPDHPQSSNPSNDFRNNSSEPSTDSTTAINAAKRRKKSEPKNIITAFTRSQQVLNTNQSLRLKFEKQKFHKVFEFNKKKLKIEQELRRKELEFKMKQELNREELELKRIQTEKPDKMEANEEKLKIEQELRREELQLKRIQADREYNIKLLEIESNERIAKYELDLKYKR